jgi:drug/metabolite transporter (DMT)-like permease
MKNFAIFELILLAAIWGSSFLFMRIAAPELGPFLLMALRTGIAGVVLLPLLFIYKQQKSISGHWFAIFIGSLFNTTIPFVLFGYAVLTLTAGLSSILNATTPMFAAIVAYFWLKDKLSISAIVGLVVGFLGVYILMSDKLSGQQQQYILPTLAILGATLCYGIGANFTKKYLQGIKPLALATSSQLCAAGVLIPISLFNLPSELPSFSAILAVSTLGVLCTGVAYVIFFRLIAEMGPAKAVSVTYLIPVFGLIWGILFLDEKITSAIILGCVVILLGVGLATGTFQRLVAKK